MRKIFIIGLVLFSFINTVFASELSYDKSNFLPVYTVIDDAAYDIQISIGAYLR